MLFYTYEAVKPMGETVLSDIVVAGGGVAGICAALAAAREGAAVSLITNRPMLGGNSSSEIRVWTRGATGGGSLFCEEMGVLGELKMRNLYTNPEFNVILWDEVLLDAVLAESRIRLFLNTHITGPKMSDNHRVESIRGFQLASEREYLFTGSYFIDATGDGTIGAGAGVPFVQGREGRDLYGEENAPGRGDAATLGHSLFFVSRKQDRPVPFIPPAYIHSMERVENFISIGGRLVNETLNGCDYWWFEFGGSLDTIGDNQDITLELKRVALGVWNYIKNSGKFDAAHLTLEWMGAIPGKRESRRFTGAYVLKQQDVMEQREFDDAVAYGGWFLDFHPAGGVYAAEANCVQIPVFAYTIPLRCLYHQDFPNLLFAGRDISVSHAAFASSRIQNTCALTGHAAGAAAAYAVSQNRPPANFSAADIHALGQILFSQDHALPGLAGGGEGNRARRARVSVSSSLEEWDPETHAAEDSDGLALDADWFLLVTKKAGAPDVSILTRSVKNTAISLSAAKQALPSRLAEDKSAEPLCLDIAAGTNWTRVPFPASFLEYEGFVLFKGDAAPGLSLLTAPVQTTGFLAGLQWSEDYRYPRVRSGIRGFYGPENLRDGRIRPYRMPWSWISAEEKEPWALLEWDAPAPMRELVVYFNPDLSRELPPSVQCSLDAGHFFSPRQGMPPELVKDFRVELRRNGTWTTVENVRNNWRRRFSLVFPEKTSGDGLRIVIESTYGSPRAEIFEIEIY
jgi:hypothetical protein